MPIGGTGGGGAPPAPSGGGVDPVSAIANAVGDFFGIFSQIGATQQTEIQTQGALLLASQPRKRETPADNSALIVLAVMVVLLLLIVYIKPKK